MQIDIKQFLKQHEIYPLSKSGWNRCKIRHHADELSAQSDDRLQKIQTKIGKNVGGVYIYYDAAGTCLYVGKSADLAGRFAKHFQRTHKRDKSDRLGKHFEFWSARAGVLTIRYFTIEREVDRKVIEIMLIHLLKPAFEEIPRTRR